MIMSGTAHVICNGHLFNYLRLLPAVNIFCSCHAFKKLVSCNMGPKRTYGCASCHDWRQCTAPQLCSALVTTCHVVDAETSMASIKVINYFWKRQFPCFVQQVLRRKSTLQKDKVALLTTMPRAVAIVSADVYMIMSAVNVL
jgi:hypothetical protein